MEKTDIFEIKAIYRDDFRVTGYTFGQGEEACCIVGSTRGNEFQQIYVCSKLVKKLTELEKKGRITTGKKIMIIPCVNPYSVNIKKRFWCIDNTDINRMFPGYNEGETTQRIAAAVFEKIKGYRFGIQFASFYMPGNFVPHVRMMKTGYEDVELAKRFGLPYVVLHNPRPFDTATLNYNWQIWETDAFSLYTTSTSEIDKESATQAVDAVLHFLASEGIIQYHGSEGYHSRVVENSEMETVRTGSAGFFEGCVKAGTHVNEGQVVAVIADPYTAEVKETLKSPCEGTVFFLHNEPMVYQNTAAFKLIPDLE